MRTQRRTNLFQKLLLVTLLSSLFVACGKDNSSGGGDSNNNGYYTYPSTSGSGNGQIPLPSNWLNVLQNEYQCNPYLSNGYNSQRVRLVMPANVNVNAGSFYVGATSAGDIAVVSNQNGQSKVELFICQRAGMTDYIQMINSPTLNYSQYCSVGEVSSMSFAIANQNGGYHRVDFRPIYADRQTQLCR